MFGFWGQVANWLFWKSKLRGGIGPWIWTVSCREGKGMKCFRCNSYSHWIILGHPKDRTHPWRWEHLHSSFSFCLPPFYRFSCGSYYLLEPRFNFALIEPHCSKMLCEQEQNPSPHLGHAESNLCFVPLGQSCASLSR